MPPEKKELSQEKLAFDAGLTRNYISIVELGQKSASLDTVEALARALGTPGCALIARAECSSRDK